MATTTQIILGSTVSPSTTSTEYCCLHGGSRDAGNVESSMAGIAAAAGLLRDLKINLATAPGSGNSWTFTVYLNGSPTSLTVTVSDAATTGSFSGSVSIAQGDYISIAITPTSTPTATLLATWALEFLTSENKTLLASSSNLGTNNLYIPVFGTYGSTSSEAATELVVPCAGTISSFFVRSNLAAGSGKYSTFTVRKNQIDQALLVTLSGAASVTGTDLSNSFTVSPGDTISIKRTGDSTASMLANFGLVFTPDVSGNFILANTSGAATLNLSTAIYFPVNASGVYRDSTENSRKQITHSLTIKNIYIKFSGNVSADQVFTLRKNGTSTALTATVASSTSAANASTDITIADNDLINTLRAAAAAQSLAVSISYTGYNSFESVANTIASDSSIKQIVQQPITSNANIQVFGTQQDMVSDGKVISSREVPNVQSDATIKGIVGQPITSDATILNTLTEVIVSDAKIIAIRQQDIVADSKITIRGQQELQSDSLIKRLGEYSELIGDAKVVIRNASTQNSDAIIKHIEETEILSDTKVVNRITVAINSNSLVKAVKYFYGQLKSRTTSTKNFFGQLIVGQSTPLNPTSLTLTDLFTGDAVELEWVNPGNYGYNVYRDIGGIWTKLNTDILVGATSYVAGALVTNVSYTFKVVGVNGLGVESSGVTGVKTPTFNASHYTEAAYDIYVDGAPLADVVLDTIELVFGPQYSTARFHLNVLPSTVGLPIANKQEITIFIRDRLVFTGRLVRRENSWMSTSLQVNYTAIDKSWDYTITTPVCAGFQGLGFGWGTDGLINSLLRGMGLPTGLPIKNSIQNSSFYDQTYREIMSAFSAECGSWVTHTDEYGIVHYYEYGHPVYNRTYTLGVNILEYKDTTDVTDQVDKIVVRSPAGRSFEEKYVSQSIQGLLVSSAEMTDVAEPNRSGSPIPSAYDSSIAQPWLAGPNGWTRAGITGRAQYIQTSYDSKPFLAFALSGYTDISDLRIEAFVNDRPEIIDPELNSAGQQLEVAPASVGLTMWATGTTENRPCANRIQKFAAAWKPVSAQTVQVGGTTYVRIDEIPVVFEDRIIQTYRTSNVISPSDASVSSTNSNVMYMEEPWQRIASIRVTFTHAGTYSTGAYGSGNVQRSQLLSTYDELTDRAHEIYSRLQHNTVQGTMSILGDETLTLRTHVNGLEIMRLTHDFSNGFRTHLDLTTPQNLYVLEVEKNYRDQVISRDINVTTEAVFNGSASGGSGTSGGSAQDKKRNIRTSGASWGD